MSVFMQDIRLSYSNIPMLDTAFVQSTFLNPSQKGIFAYILYY